MIVETIRRATANAAQQLSMAVSPVLADQPALLARLEERLQGYAPPDATALDDSRETLSDMRDDLRTGDRR